jgi:hypothetical protein
MRCKFAAEQGKIESSVDLPHHMIFENGIAKTKLVEQLTLSALDGPSWIDLAENRVNTKGITVRRLSQPTSATKSANNELNRLQF